MFGREAARSAGRVLGAPALTAAIALAVASSAMARQPAVHIGSASGGGATVYGYAPKREMLNVTFDAARCATSFAAESRRSVSSFGERVKGAYSFTFGPGDYQANVAMYVCVYMRTLSPSHPRTVATAFAALG